MWVTAALWLVLCACACAAARARWVRVRGYWAARGVPHRKPHPLLGSLTFLQKENTALWMRGLYREFRSPYVGVWLAWRPALVVQSPVLARRLLAHDQEAFRDRFLGSGDTDPIGKLNLFTVNEPVWSGVRRRLTGVFAGSRLRALRPLLADKTDELVRRLAADTRRGRHVDLRATFADFTTDVFGAAAFGVRGEATLRGGEAGGGGGGPLRQVTRDFMRFSRWRGLGWASIFFCPELVDVFRFKFFPKESTDYFRAVFRAAAARREAEAGAGQGAGAPRDLLDALLQLRRGGGAAGAAGAPAPPLGEDALVAQAAIFLLGAFDTTAVTLTFLVCELAHCQEAQTKLHAELCEAVEGRGDADFDVSSLAELPYLNCVIKESLRLHATMGWLDRVAARNYRLDDSLTVPAGMPVYVNADGMHYDPAYFPEPERFRPERFLAGAEPAVQPYTYLPFGEGPRGCIGKRFALYVVRHVVLALVLRYRVTPRAGYPPPAACRLEDKGLMMTPGEVLSVHFTHRHRHGDTGPEQGDTGAGHGDTGAGHGARGQPAL